MTEDEIVEAFESQENIGLAVDHQDYAGDLVEDWNIDPRELRKILLISIRL
ncbi:hypothetical protein ACC870_15415 [Rhizobium ruizarguesonis]